MNIQIDLEKFVDTTKESTWLTDGFSKSELKKIKMLALVSARIESKRRAMGLNQKEFASLMGVSQGMISKWESGEYNFSLTTLHDICDRLNLEFKPEIQEKKYLSEDSYKVVSICSRKRKGTKKIGWNNVRDGQKKKGEGIA